MSTIETATIEQTAAIEYPDWQKADVDHLASFALSENVGTANWSEMGCYKTTTGLRHLKRLVDHRGVENPNILIVTSKSGKGTFYEWIPQIMEGFTIVNLESDGMYFWMDGEEVKLPEIKFVPKMFEMPTICLTHYQVLSRPNKGKFEVDKDKKPIRINGKLILKAWNQADFIAERKWDIIWADEAHRLKEKDNRWTVQLKKCKTTDKHLSTGTGFINRPDEVWSLLNWLDRRNFSSYNAFKDEFCLIDDWDGYEKVVGTKPEKLEEFRALVRRYGARRTLDEVFPDIKQPIFSPRDVDLNPTQRKMYDELKTQLQTLDKNGVPFNSPNVLSMLQRLRQICVATPEVISDEYDPKEGRRITKIRLKEPSSKLDEVMRILDELQWDDEAKQPVVIFSNFVDPLDMLRARFDMRNAKAAEVGRDKPYPYIWMKQADDDRTRFDKWKVKFGSGNYRIFMSTLQLGGESINLTPARHIIFVDRSWSPKDNSQGIGRIRRPGQTGQPVVVNINARKTTDQRIEQVNNIKQGWFNEIFGD